MANLLPANDSLSLVESASNSGVVLNSEIAAKGLQTFGEFSKSCSDPAIVVETVDAIQAQCSAHRQALESSVKTVQKALQTCMLSESWCDLLLDYNYDAMRMGVLIKPLRDAASHAKDHAASASRDFQAVFNDLSQITGRIPKKVKDVDGKLEHTNNERDAAEESRMNWKVRSRGAGVATGLTGLAGAATWFGWLPMVAIASPGLCFAVPIVLGVSAAGSGIMAHRSGKKAAVRAAESTKHAETMARFEELTSATAQLAEGVEMFVDWWVEADTELKGLEQRTNNLNLDGIPATKVRVKTIKEDWTKRRAAYQEYLALIRKVQPHLLSQPVSSTTGRAEIVRA